MSGEWPDRLDRLTRRLAIVALTVGVVAAAIATVNVAAQWRATAAPLGTAPVSLDTIALDAAAERDRVAALGGQLDDAAAQIEIMRAAIAAADGNVTTDSQTAGRLQRQLDTAARRLQTLQGQLRAAKGRLDELNAAADRQAELNSVSSAASADRTSGGGHGEDEGEDDDDDD